MLEVGGRRRKNHFTAQCRSWATTTRTYEKHLSECLHVMPSNAINKKAITNFNQRQIQQVFCIVFSLLSAESFLWAFVCDLSECKHAEDVNGGFNAIPKQSVCNRKLLAFTWLGEESRKVCWSCAIGILSFRTENPLDQKKLLEVRQSLHHN